MRTTKKKLEPEQTLSVRYSTYYIVSPTGYKLGAIYGRFTDKGGFISCVTQSNGVIKETLLSSQTNQVFRTEKEGLEVIREKLMLEYSKLDRLRDPIESRLKTLSAENDRNQNQI